MMPVIDVAAAAAPRWSAAARIGFRFSVLYFGSYVLLTQMLGSLLMLPFDEMPSIGEVPPFRTAVAWTARHVFRVMTPLVITGSGSGDKTFDWVQAFCLLIIAILATVAWSVLDRRRRDYERAHAWFRVFLRFALGSTMATYGIMKLVPIQMGSVTLTRLVEPYGQFSPMGALWAFIATSTPYQMLVGAAELTPGLLLFVPRTATLGAIIALGDAVQIFTLNMTYDVPVKLFSFHLIVMSLVLLAPNARQLADLLVRARPTDAIVEPPLGRTPRRRRVLLAAQTLFAIYIVAMNFYGAEKAWYEFGGGAPKSPLYGIWVVDAMAVDGVTRAPVITDCSRWRRVIFDTRARLAFQCMDDSFVFYTAQFDDKTNMLAMTRGADQMQATFRVVRRGTNQMTLTGALDNQTVDMRLQRSERDRFLLVSRGFHWVQEYPFNR